MQLPLYVRSVVNGEKDDWPVESFTNVFDARKVCARNKDWPIRHDVSGTQILVQRDEGLVENRFIPVVLRTNLKGNFEWVRSLKLPHSRAYEFTGLKQLQESRHVLSAREVSPKLLGVVGVLEEQW